jgi:5-methylcytosine-specific restriction endonuclease McrA
LKKDYAGLRFGRLLVVSKTTTKIGNSFGWICRCDCGTEKILNPTNLKSTKSCGCLRRDLARERSPRANEARRDLPGEAGLSGVFRNYKTSSKRKGFDFRLTREDVRDLTQGLCYYCDEPPLLVSKRSSKTYNAAGRERTAYRYNGIDRKDNSKGYTLDNVVPCCWPCNLMKRDMNHDEFLAHVSKIAAKQGR